ncbi:hypothetical protein [Blastococcus sp. SYSU D01042]
MTTTATLTIPKLHLGSRPEERLTHLVLNSERLLRAVPTAELADLVRSYEAATEAAAEARRLPAEPDLTAEIDAALQAGDPIDPAALMDRVGRLAHVSLTAGLGNGDKTLPRLVLATPRVRVIAVLDSVARAYNDRIVDLIGSDEDRYLEDLGESLEDLLDRAEPVAESLAGIGSAEAAIRAQRADDWARLMELTSEYATLREEQRALLRLTGEDLGGRTARLLQAYFRTLHNMWPNFATHVQTPQADLLGQTVPVTFSAPFDVFDVSSPLHLLAVVRGRELLNPHVGRGAAAV